MPIDGVSKIHMQAPNARATLGNGGGSAALKFGIFAAIVAIFGAAFYFMSGSSSQSPVGAPAASAGVGPAGGDPNAAASTKADVAAAKDQAAPPAQPAAAPAEQGSAPQAAAPGDVPAQAAAPAQPASATAPADDKQAAPPAEPAQAAAAPAQPAAAPAAVADAAPAQDAAPAAAPAPVHKAAHKKARAAAHAVDKVADSATAPVQAATQPDAASALNPWWQGAEAQPFRITAVSPVKDQPALAVVFSAPVSPAAGEHLKLLNNDGSAAAGSWAQGATPYVLVRSGVAPGRYMLLVDGAVASTDGKSLGNDMSGPVYVLASR